MKKLKLNKESLIALQARQMKALLGGDELASSGGTTGGYTIYPQCPGPMQPTDSPDAVLEGTGSSCCRKSCRS